MQVLPAPEFRPLWIGYGTLLSSTTTTTDVNGTQTSRYDGSLRPPPALVAIGALTYLWPLWDQRKQTFSDKIMSTYVIHATEPQTRPY